MSANELEHLMSQLNVNTVLPGDVNSLGAGPGENTAGYTWRYTQQKTHAEDGIPRHQPLPDDYMPKNREIPYIPQLTPGIVDLYGNPLSTFTVPKDENGKINFKAMNLKQLETIFLNEYYKKKRISQIYNRLKQNLENQKEHRNNNGQNRPNRNRPVRIRGTASAPYEVKPAGGGGRGGGGRAAQGGQVQAQKPVYSSSNPRPFVG